MKGPLPTRPSGTMVLGRLEGSHWIRAAASSQQLGFGHFLVTSVGSDAANFHASVGRGSGLHPVVFLLRVELGPHFHHLSVSAVKQGWG